VEIVVPIKITEFNLVRPDVITMWQPGNGALGLTSVYLYGDNLYYMDSTRGSIIEYDVMTGRYISRFTLPDGIISMGQFSGGGVITLSKGNIITLFSGTNGKDLRSLRLDGCVEAVSLAVDSKDNIIVADSSNKIIRYDANFNKESEFAVDKSGSVGKVYIGPGDSVYLLDYYPSGRLYVEIFNRDGVFVGKIDSLRSKQFLGFEELAITPDGGFYINYLQGSEIYYYSAHGKLLGKFNRTSDGITKISSPAGICGGKNGFFVIPSFEVMVLKNIKS
jgi:hypothetical protein